MEFKHHRLANGLEVIAEVNPQAFSTALGFFVKTGSRDETPEMAGVSHFLEHMMFKGTPSRTAADINRMLDELGSQSNAYTSEEQTVYYMTVLPELQDDAVALLTDMMRPALREEDFETERQVILEEIAMYDDQPPYGAMERIMEAYFGDHPLARRVLGTQETVKDLRPEAMREYHARRYAPDNLCLVAAGAVDFAALVAKAERLTQHWEPKGASRSLHIPTPNSQMIQLCHPPAVQQYTIQYSPGPSRKDPRKYATRIMATILGDDSGSRLFWALVDNGAAETAVLFTSEYQECGLVGAYLSCTPEDTADNWQTMNEIVRQALQEPITDKELAQAKNKIRSGIALSSERPGNRLFTVGNAWTLRETYETVSDVVDRYNAVTREEVQQALVDWLNQPRVGISVGPKEDVGLNSDA